MRWQVGRRSSNIEDRRGMSAGRPMLGGRGMFGGGGGLGRGLPIGRGGGIGGIVLAAIVLGILYFSGQFDGGGSDRGYAPSPLAPGATSSDEQADFVSAVLADTEDTWNPLFQSMQAGDYAEPALVLFNDAVDSACGFAEAAVGPFYCPTDQKVYLDLTFFQELSQRFGAPGDFAAAYVIAHEIGHHVQNLLGISTEVRSAQRGLGEAEANSLSVQLELQADCFAGVWAFHADAMRNVIEPGDVDEALGAASAIGDDRLQRQGQGYVVPESFTHGTSQQRASWFKRGLASGKVSDCDTFGASTL